MSDKKSIGCLGMIGVVFIICCLFALIMASISHTESGNAVQAEKAAAPKTAAPPADTVPAPDAGDPERAFFAGQDACKKVLKAPSTAKFSSYALTKTPDGIHGVTNSGRSSATSTPKIHSGQCCAIIGWQLYRRITASTRLYISVLRARKPDPCLEYVPHHRRH